MSITQEQFQKYKLDLYVSMVTEIGGQATVGKDLITIATVVFTLGFRRKMDILNFLSNIYLSNTCKGQN